MANGITNLTSATFDETVSGSDVPVLVDFWAEWCGPCKMIAPVLNEIADEYEGKLTVAKLDVDSNPATPNQYGVRGIPTLMIFNGGNVQGMKVGAVSKGMLQAFIDETI